MIRLENVTKIYASGVVALDNINLEVERGEFAFLVGASGSGKTTLMKLLMREEKATQGQIAVDGKDLIKMRQSEVPYLRRSLGAIFQDFRLLEDRTAYENIAFAMQVIEASKRLMEKSVAAVLEIVGLSDKQNRLPNQLSGGERQRVAIARAIVNNPRIVIADEPTGNLDPETGWDIMDIFQRINAAGTTIIMATHDRDIVNRMYRRVIELESGRIVRDEKRGGYESFMEKYGGGK